MNSAAPGPVAARTPPAKARSYRSARAALITGLALLLPAVVTIVPEFYRAISSPTVAVPGTVRRNLTIGGYVIFEHTGRRNRVGPITTSVGFGVTIRPGDVSVIDPAGNAVRTQIVRRMTQTIHRNGSDFTAAVEFSARMEGEYRITVKPENPGDIVVSRTFDNILRRAASALLAALVGGLCVLGSLVLLIVNLRRPSIGASSPTAPLHPSAAWYPDPERPRGQRYWDGQRWTEHRA